MMSTTETQSCIIDVEFMSANKQNIPKIFTIFINIFGIIYDTET